MLTYLIARVVLNYVISPVVLTYLKARVVLTYLISPVVLTYLIARVVLTYLISPVVLTYLISPVVLTYLISPVVLTYLISPVVLTYSISPVKLTYLISPIVLAYLISPLALTYLTLPVVLTYIYHRYHWPIYSHLCCLVSTELLWRPEWQTQTTISSTRICWGYLQLVVVKQYMWECHNLSRHAITFVHTLYSWSWKLVCQLCRHQYLNNTILRILETAFQIYQRTKISPTRGFFGPPPGTKSSHCSHYRAITTQGSILP